MESSSLYIEGIWTALVIGGIFTVLRLVSSHEEVKKDLLLGGLFLGGAAACKAVTFTILPVLALVLLISFRRLFSRKLLGVMGISLATFLVVGSIPYVRAMVYTGNPFFPFFNGIFKSPLYLAENFDASSRFEVGIAWDTLYRMIFNSGKYLEATPGAAGFQWLLLVVPGVVILLLTKNRRALLVAFIAFVSLWLTFEQTAYLRYVFPSFALVCTVIAAAFQSLSKNTTNRWGWYFCVMIAAITVSLNLVHFDSAGYYGNIDLRVITDERKRDEYVENVVPLRKAVELVNAINKDMSPVAFFPDTAGAGLKTDALYASWYNHRFLEEVLSAQDEKRSVAFLRVVMSNLS